MSKAKLILYSLPLLAFLVLGYFFLKALNSDPSLLPSTRIDQKIPAFTLPALANAQRMLSEQDVKGPLLLNVWATWCPSCKVEHPVLNELAKNGIRIVGLNYKDVREAALKYLEYNGNPYQYSIYDEAGDLGLDLGVYGAPETYLVDAEGVIRYRHVGVVTPDNWRELLWPKWQEMGGKGP
ncbi:MAG: DsbE family thiol:disulfide interchange protein [Pseudomonadales bacterium]|uniref:DsbE family thiol:disulfide interchange protein n=1 Tax=unclassified Ketobacter TaxID=2639109 RepID=UPI000C356F53|nr:MULTISPECIES: DsbE family thiol:disulfide interchange protein [unclassified Ketobacter]MAQ25061.1 DsbE family thiol:disulfide interchange protein [Pseudomonadales bacterium]MCK5792081.1 DsbE family thiol:disulfide interchange protein [Ketobacter sp.]MEC8814120.1 DsbE family thiol:disulfide interchange protein [Pseudomonadota bacterium]RLT88545.1 MAG: DsbE family thiol:disulfide interchange protein [Ketobacter sp. GenoA1]TNC89676.1 MAG: DsbE family thiol:disulfide interchange protein [Alcani